MSRRMKWYGAVLAALCISTGVSASEPVQLTTDPHLTAEAMEAELNRPVVPGTVYVNTKDLLTEYRKTVEIPVNREPQAKAINLEEVVKAAIQQSRDIKMSRLALAQAETAVSAAAGSKNPSLSYSWRRTEVKPVEKEMEIQGHKIKVSINHLYNQGFNLTWPIWTGGAAEGAIDAARYAKNIANISLYQAEAEAKLEAVKAYYQYVEAVHLSRVASETVQNLEKHKTNVENQYKAGIVAKLDVLSSEVSLANAKQKNIAAQNGRKLAEANLNRMIGAPMDSHLLVEGTVFPEPEFTLTQEEALALGAKYRWELIKADYNVKIAKEKIRIARAGYMPKVAVGGQYGWNTAGLDGRDKADWALYGAVSLDIFDGGITPSKIKEAKLGLALAQETMLKAKEGIELEIRQDYLQVVAAKEQIKTAKAAVAQAEEAYKIASVRYTSGVGINLDVLDAELALNQAKINHITALYNYNIGLAVLEKAIGLPAVMHPEFQKAKM